MKRIQLTLFIDEPVAAPIELIRKQFNPEQYQLIRSHVTICREDELEQTERIIRNLSALDYNPITLHFGQVIRFSEEKGVLMPVIGGNDQFHQLRRAVLNEVISNPRLHEPHITLMHPRNSTCTDAIFQQIQQIKLPDKIIFRTISLIEQEDEKKWKVLNEYFT